MDISGKNLSTSKQLLDSKYFAKFHYIPISITASHQWHSLAQVSAPQGGENFNPHILCIYIGNQYLLKKKTYLITKNT